MRPLSAALLVSCLCVAPALAQDVTTDAAGAANAKLTIDPKAALDTQPQSVDILTGLYATLATVDICKIELAEPVSTAMNADRKRLETSLSMDEATADKAYASVHDDVEKTGLDCSDGSTDRQQTDAVISVYSSAK